MVAYPPHTMYDLLVQSLIPFLFSALIVILITVVAEKYGTKIGGIIGTLPSTIIVAFVFIALNHGELFAAESVAVVPAGMGVNILFLLTFVLVGRKGLLTAIVSSLTLWFVLSATLYYINLTNIYISLTIFIIVLLAALLVFEKIKKIPSQSRVHVHYTPLKVLFRGVIAGIIISISVLLANTGAVISGIFSIFPAIFLSTMVISNREHGTDFAAGIAKSMVYGCSSVTSYGVVIHFAYPYYGILSGTVIAYLIAVAVTLLLFGFRHNLS